MDIVLDVCDRFLGFDQIYGTVFPHNTTNPTLQYLATFGSDNTSSLARDNIVRQALSLFTITWLFGVAIYFCFAGLSYWLIFDHRTFLHPKYLKNQIRLEIQTTMSSLPIMAICTTPWFLAEVRGYSKMYGSISDHGLAYFVLQIPLFLAFTDSLIYLIHRALHSKVLYKRLHKPHHKWIMPTPFASHAFHPMDGYAQSLPYHVFPFIFPLHKYAYIALFTFINIWTVLIHDGEYLANDPIINGAACHSLHHLKFTCNYGQFTTLFDRLGGSYVAPDPELFDKEINRAMWEQQSKEVDAIKKTIGDSDESSQKALIQKPSVFQKKDQ